MDRDISSELSDRVRAATDSETPLRILGGDTKAFFGRKVAGEPLDVKEHTGIVSYEPTELVITARGGTPLAEVESALSERGQMLPFEPPHFNEGSTLGGAVASGLSGPRRPWGGAPRDLLLGVKLLDGKGEILRFGGQVMKNVAGYDLSRLMAGAMGTLGVLLEVSIRVAPRPLAEFSLTIPMSASTAINTLSGLGRRPLPLTGACHFDETLHLRFACDERLFESIRTDLNGETKSNNEDFWNALRDQRLGFFQEQTPLWRISVPPAAKPISLKHDTLIDWAGAQRWVRLSGDPAPVSSAASDAGGHAELFRHGDRSGEVFQPLPPLLEKIHRGLKAVFDPAGILNPGRLYAGW